MTSALMKPFSKSVWMTRGRLGAFAPFADGPGADLGLARGEERDETEELEARAHDGVQAGLLEAGAREKLGAVGRVELGDLRLERRADGHDGRALGRRRAP